MYGDGSVIRDFIFIDDAIHGILNIANGNGKYKLYNLGYGKGTSVNQVIQGIENVLNKKLSVRYIDGRKADVPINYLDIGRYEADFGALNPVSLEEGIKKTVDFMVKNYE